MKRLIFVLLCYTIFAAGAQNLTFLSDNEEVTDTIVFQLPTTDNLSDHCFQVRNITANALHLTLEKQILQMLPNSVNSFCLGICYDPRTTISTTTLDLDPQQISTCSDFHLQYNPKGSEGVTMIRYVFREQEEVMGSIIVKFVSAETGISTHNIALNAFFAYPNPAHSQVSIQYELSGLSSNNAQIVLTNLVGSKVCVFPLNSNTSGKVNVDISTLVSGIYFYSLEINGKMLSSKKLIIK